MSELNNISIVYDENELQILTNENNNKSTFNGNEAWDLIFNVNINDFFKENDTKIITFLNILKKYVEKCFSAFSEELLNQWIMGININILSNGQNKKNEIVITEIIEFMEIQLNILENNKERYKNIDSISEWIIKYQKFHENFKNLNYEWKIFEKYLNILEKLLTLDNEQTNLNHEKDTLLSIISYASSRNQYTIRNEILEIIKLIVKYEFDNKKDFIKDIYNLIFNSLENEMNIKIKNNKISLLNQLINEISINKEISSNLVTFLLIELSKNDITQSNTKEFLSSIKDNEFVKKFVYTIICGNKIDNIESPEKYLDLLIGCFTFYDAKEYLLSKSSLELLFNKLVDIKRTIRNNNDTISGLNQISHLLSSSLTNEELNAILSYFLNSNKIESLTNYEIDCMFFMEKLYQNQSKPLNTNIEKCKIVKENINDKIENISNEDIIQQICNKLEPKSLFNRDFNEVEDKSFFKRVDEFKTMAKSLFEIFNCIVQREISINIFEEILYCCSMFLGDEDNNKWSSDETRALSREIIKITNEKLNKLENDNNDVDEKFLINKYYEDILINKIKVLFNQPYRGSKTKGDYKSNLYNIQLWKTDHPSSVYAFNWLTFNVDVKYINNYFSQMVPIILTLIDDYQIPYKLLGVRLTNYCILNHTDPVQIRSTGLANVFLEALRLCLSFHSDPELMDESLPCIISLIKLMINYNDPQNSPEFFSLIEKIITEDIIKGISLSIGKSSIVIFLKHLPSLVDSLGVVFIRYLQIFIGPCCEILSFNYGNYENQFYASNALLSIINACIPRINKYIGMIMESTAESWRRLKKREMIRKDADLKETDIEMKTALEENLKSIYKTLINSKIESVENNIALLNLIDPTIFHDLINIV